MTAKYTKGHWPLVHFSAHWPLVHFSSPVAIGSFLHQGGFQNVSWAPRLTHSTLGTRKGKVASVILTTVSIVPEKNSPALFSDLPSYILIYTWKCKNSHWSIHWCTPNGEAEQTYPARMLLQLTKHWPKLIQNYGSSNKLSTTARYMQKTDSLCQQY